MPNKHHNSPFQDSQLPIGSGSWSCSTDGGGDGAQRGSQQLRRRNRTHLLQLLRQGELTRSELCSASGLTGAAVSRITRELLQAKLLVEKKCSGKTAGAGRRSVRLALNPAGIFVVGVTITANRLEVAISDCHGVVVSQSGVRLADTHNPDRVLEELLRVTKNLVAKSQQEHGNQAHGTHSNKVQSSAAPATGFDRTRLAGIGISVAVSSGDSIRRTDGMQTLVSSRALGWKSIDVASPFASAFNLPVEVEPRAVALLRSEANQIVSARKKVNGGENTSIKSAFCSMGCLSVDQGGVAVNGNVFLVNVGLGLATATRFDHNIYGCSSDRIGDLTHLAHPESTQLCECGRHGCLQQVATGAAVVRDTARARSAETARAGTADSARAGTADTASVIDPTQAVARDTKHGQQSIAQLGNSQRQAPDQISHACATSAGQPQSMALSELNSDLEQALGLAQSGDTIARQALFNAGKRLAFGLDLVHALLDPDQIVLAGAVGRNVDYVAGVRHGLVNYRTPLQRHQLRVSQFTSSVAAVSIGLEAFVFSNRLDLKRFIDNSPGTVNRQGTGNRHGLSHSDLYPGAV